MSHIFDALQRSEAERATGPGSGSLAATELLERVEHQAASKWSSAAEADPRNDLADARNLLHFGTPGSASDGTAAQGAAAEASPAAGPEEGFPQFQTLNISLPRPSRVVCLTETDTPAVEAFRLLGVRLRHLRRDRPLRSVLITSTIPEEGKSLVAANLACTLGTYADQKTLLLEGDVRKPSLSKILGIDPAAGLCTCLEGHKPLAECVYRLEGAGFWILPAGSVHSTSLEIIQSPQLPSLMEQLASWFDWIVIDSPPALPLADTSVWTRLADGILLVARRGITEKRLLKRGIEALEPQKLIGAVMNSSTTLGQNYYYYRHSPAPPQNS